MAQGIQRQAEQYDYAPEIQALPERQAAVEDLPGLDSVKDLLGGPSIQAGMLHD